MILCLCNNLGSDAVQRALEAGMKSYEEILSFHGHLPNCGACEGSLNKQLLLYKYMFTGVPLCLRVDTCFVMQPQVNL